MFARESVLGEVRGVKIHSPLGFTLTLEARSSRAYVLDRTLFDRIMFHKAVDAGAVRLRPRWASADSWTAGGTAIPASLFTSRRFLHWSLLSTQADLTP